MRRFFMQTSIAGSWTSSQYVASNRIVPPGRHKLVLRSGQTQQFSVPAAEPIWIEEQR